LKLHNNDWN